MLLAIDVGNSNIDIGVFEEAELRMRAKASARTERSADEYAAMLGDLLRLRGIAGEEIDGCILSSVVPELTGLIAEAARTAAGVTAVKVGPGIRTGFRIGIDDPSQLGGDLVADSLAALTEYGAPLVLIDAGTVTAVAAIDAARTYLGGSILPGIRRSAAVLKETAALLPSIGLDGPAAELLGRDSIGAMRSGLLWGSAIMVDGFIDRYRAMPGMAGAKCVATGGSDGLVTALCQREVILDEELTLKGLRYLYIGNRPRRGGAG